MGAMVATGQRRSMTAEQGGGHRQDAGSSSAGYATWVPAAGRWVVRCLLVVGLAAGGPAAGCLAPAPVRVHSGEWGMVRADDPAQLADIVERQARLLPRVVAALPGAQPQPSELWVQEQLRYYRFAKRASAMNGFTIIDSHPVRVHMQAGADFLDWTLAHEYVHAFAHAEWDLLPPIAEEGLCDVVALEVCPNEALTIRTRRTLNALAYLEPLRFGLELEEPLSWDTGQPITRHGMLTVTPRQPARWSLEEILEGPIQDRSGIREVGYGVGFVLVHRIAERHGLDYLRALCKRARAGGHRQVPMDWLLEAAELPPEAPWPLDLVFETPHLEVLVRAAPALFERLLLPPLLVLWREADGELEIAQFLARARPRLIASNGDELSLLELPDLLQRLESGLISEPPR